MTHVDNAPMKVLVQERNKHSAVKHIIFQGGILLCDHCTNHLPVHLSVLLSVPGPSKGASRKLCAPLFPRDTKHTKNRRCTTCLLRACSVEIDCSAQRRDRLKEVLCGDVAPAKPATESSPLDHRCFTSCCTCIVSSFSCTYRQAGTHASRRTRKHTMHDRKRHHGPPHYLLVLRAFAHALVSVPTMTQTSLTIAACFIKGYMLNIDGR